MTARESDAAPFVEWPDPSPLEPWWTSIMGFTRSRVTRAADPRRDAATPTQIPRRFDGPAVSEAAASEHGRAAVAS